MSFIGLVVLILIAAVVLWGIHHFPTLDATLKRIIEILIYVGVSIAVILWLAGFFFGYRLPSFR